MNPYPQYCTLCEGEGSLPMHRECHNCNGTGKVPNEEGYNLKEFLEWWKKYNE